MVEIILLPLISSIFSLLINNRKALWVFSTISCFLLTFLSLFLKEGYFSIFFIDYFSKIFVFMVSLVSSFIFLYSYSYIKKKFRKYWFFMNLFLFSMITLLISSNLIVIFICWELLGICSWALISLYENKESLEKALRVLLVTSISDIFLLISIGIIWFYTKKIYGKPILDIVILSKKREWIEIVKKDIPFFPIILYLGPLGKSSQLPFYFWLLDAMVGPATVSALLHSSTMVKSGIYLSMRFSNLFDPYPAIFFGILSSIVSSILACFDKKIKRILAYSTISNLGIMFSSLRNPFLTIYYAFFHALFKSSLFLFSGIVSKRSGNIFYLKLPKDSLLKLSFILSTVSMSGILVHYIKHEIFGESLLLYLTSFLSAFYSFRLLFIILSRKEKKFEVPKEMKTSLVTLSFLTILFFRPSLSFVSLLSIPICYYLYWGRRKPLIEKEIKLRIWRIRIPSLELEPNEFAIVFLIAIILGGVFLWFHLFY